MFQVLKRCDLSTECHSSSKTRPSMIVTTAMYVRAKSASQLNEAWNGQHKQLWFKKEKKWTRILRWLDKADGMSMSPGPMVLSARMASSRAVFLTHRLAIHGATKIAPDFIPQKCLKWSVTNHFMVIIRGRHRNHGFCWFLISISFLFLLVFDFY